MTKHSDVIVIGSGAVGSASARALAKRGKRVRVFDKNNPPHSLGSSGGDTRITRLAIGEGDFYSQFVIRSHQIWRELEADTGLDLLTSNGGLIMASQNDNYVLHGNSDFLGETIRAAEKYRIPDYEILDTAGIHKKFPQFNLVGDEVGYYEPTAGFLRPENCIRAQIEVAQKYGAEIHTNEEVLDINPVSNGVVVRTNAGNYFADKVIISVGAWIHRFLPPEFKSFFRVSRQVLFWFDIVSNFNAYLPENFPIFIWQKNEGFVYGFPAIDGPNGGMKLASEVVNVTNPDSINRDVSMSDIKEMYRNHVQGFFPDLTPACLKAVVCMYTSIPDSHFVIDYHPEFPHIIIASPCSAHGFKHSPSVGEAVAEMAIDGKTTLDISLFSLSRFKT